MAPIFDKLNRIVLVPVLPPDTENWEDDPPYFVLPTHANEAYRLNNPMAWREAHKLPDQTPARFGEPMDYEFTRIMDMDLYKGKKQPNKSPQQAESAPRRFESPDI